MMIKFSEWMKKRGSAVMIYREGKPYMLRHFIFKSDSFSIFIHRMYSPDNGSLHDHPANFCSLILCGGYVEYYHDGSSYNRLPGDFIYKNRYILHRIDKLFDPGNTFTIFIFFKRKRKWGFLHNTKFETIDKRISDSVRGSFFPKKYIKNVE